MSDSLPDPVPGSSPADALADALADAQRAVLAEIAVLEAEESRLFARRMRARAEVDQLWNQEAHAQEQFGVIELAGTVRIGQGRACTQLIHGTRLVTELPLTLAALDAGRMFVHGAVQLLELTLYCNPKVTAELERRVLPVIEVMNTLDARRLILQTIPEVEADLDPELTQQRLEEAATRRRVWMRELGDGVVEVGAGMDAIEARRWALDFDELVRAQRVLDRKAGIVRTADQRRAAVFAQLPSRLIELVRAIQAGTIGELLAIAQSDPHLAEQLEALAAAAPAPAATDPEADTDQEAVLAADTDEEADGDEQDRLTLELRPVRTPKEPFRPNGNQRLGPFREEHPFIDEPLDSGAERCPEPIPEQPPPLPAPANPSRVTEQLLVEVLSLQLRDPKLLNVHVPMSTLLELDNRAGSIDGLGLLPAQRIRQLLPSFTLRRVLTDPDSGVPIGVDPTLHQPPHAPEPPAAAKAHRARPETRDESLNRLDDERWARLAPLLTSYLLTETAQGPHDPSPSLRELIVLRDQRCTGIGCSQPASRCHLDHERPYPHGPTAVWNLGAKSARCHRAKHAGWIVSRPNDGPGSGTITWTSPLGHSYTRPTRWTKVP